MDGWKDKWMDGGIKWMDGGIMDGWRDNWMDEGINGWMEWMG